jgi:iron complex transport system substrate-binding protein
MNPSLTLARRAAASVLAVALVAALAACDQTSGAAGGSGGSGASDAEAGAAAGDAGWSFTDDTGTTVELPQTPTRIAGLTDAISSLWSYGIQPVAVFGFTAMADDSSFDGKDLEKVTEVGRNYGEINLEALAAADPDLIVTHVYPENGGELTGDELLYGFADQAQLDAVRQIAPVVAIEMAGTADEVVTRTNELAASLGVDFSSEELTRAKQDYEDAAARLSSAAQKGLTVMAAAAYPDEGLYIAKAPDDPSLAYYAKLGVDFPDPGGEEYYWQTVSWEQIGNYGTDVILNSTRAMSIEEVLQQPTFAALPAAQASQVFDWNSQNMDYVAQARNMNDLAGWLEQSEKVT